MNCWPLCGIIPTCMWRWGTLQIAISRAEYYAYLKRIVDAGYGDRVMFGSDVGLADFGTGIDAIVDADFLTEAQKRDILYNNAARFLRLSNGRR